MAAAVALPTKQQPVQLTIGSGIAHYKSPFNGTLGAFVVSSRGQIGLLSAHHVLAPGSARQGDAIVTRQSDGAGIAIATLGPGECSSRCDAAVAWLTEGATADVRLPNLHRGFSGVRPPQAGDVLVKIGSTTGLTRARVTALDCYPARFGEQVLAMQAMYLEPLYDRPCNQLVSQAGDSGAVWFDEQTGQAVGLHFAGESFSAYGPIHAKACYMTSVLAALNVRLWSTR